LPVARVAYADPAEEMFRFCSSPILAGTKWCGEGNIASNFYDIGQLTELDNCCREHDFCADYIFPRSIGKHYDELANIDVAATG
jgi:hypothetical protein